MLCAGQGRIGGRGLLTVEEIAAVLLQGFQGGLDVGGLVLGGFQGVHVQQGGDGLRVAAPGGGDGLLEHPVKGQVRQLLLVGLGLVGEVLGELGHLPLEVLHVHPLEGLQTLRGGAQLLLDAVVVRKGLLGLLHVPPVLHQDGFDDLFRQRRVPYLEVLQKFRFHLLLLSVD